MIYTLNQKGYIKAFFAFLIFLFITVAAFPHWLDDIEKSIKAIDLSVYEMTKKQNKELNDKKKDEVLKKVKKNGFAIRRILNKNIPSAEKGIYFRSARSSLDELFTITDASAQYHRSLKLINGIKTGILNEVMILRDNLGHEFPSPEEEDKELIRNILSSKEFIVRSTKQNTWMLSLKRWFRDMMNEVFQLNWDMEDVEKVAKGVNYTFFFSFILIVLYIIIRPYLRRKSQNEEHISFRRSSQLNSSDLNLTYSQLKGEKRFREGLRAYFLFLISRFEDEGWLFLDKSHTNNEYALFLADELGKNNTAVDDFYKIKDIFQDKWYGVKDVDDNELQEFENAVNHFIDGLLGEANE